MRKPRVSILGAERPTPAAAFEFAVTPPTMERIHPGPHPDETDPPMSKAEGKRKADQSRELGDSKRVKVDVQPNEGEEDAVNV